MFVIEQHNMVEKSDYIFKFSKSGSFKGQQTKQKNLIFAAKIYFVYTLYYKISFSLCKTVSQTQTFL